MEIIDLTQSDDEVSLPRWWQWCRVLGDEEDEYVKVKGEFLDGIWDIDLGAVVTKIYKVTKYDDLRVKRFEIEKEVLENFKGDANVSFGWYGICKEGVQAVIGDEFPRPKKFEGFAAYGAGVYLSPVRLGALHSVMFSEMDGNGEKHVILCRVLLGKCEKIEAGSQQWYPSSFDSDTGVDDLENPKWYVVWPGKMNSRIIPEYVVSYRPSIGLSGQSRGTLDLDAILNSSLLTEKLFTKLGATLPASRVEKFQTLCNAYKGGAVAKYNFVLQFQSVVGEEKLLSAIGELLG